MRERKFPVKHTLRAKLVLLSLYNRHRFIRLQYVYEISNNVNCPKQLIGYLVKQSLQHCRSLRDSTLVELQVMDYNFLIIGRVL